MTADHALRGLLLIILTAILGALPVWAQDEDYEYIDSDMCVDCHEESAKGTSFDEDLSMSIHEGFECLDCHETKGTIPHTIEEGYHVGYDGCAMCHDDVMEGYVAHGRRDILTDGLGEAPSCSDCHGDHAILPSDMQASRVHPTNLSATCASCHEDINLVERNAILKDHPAMNYAMSVHGQATQQGELAAATCNDCHANDGAGHEIRSANHPESTIHYFNIPKMCGECHPTAMDEYTRGIHGKMVERGMASSPVCTNCHGDHGIISPSDPNSPVSRQRLAEATCAPCHNSYSLNRDLVSGTREREINYIDSFHGLKSKAGDPSVANCSSCHSYHLVLPSSDPHSSIHPENLAGTCGECHPGISAELAAVPIHDVGGVDPRAPITQLIEKIYIWLIAIVIGGMFLHTLMDYIKQVRNTMEAPSVRRMRGLEAAQHMALLLSFGTLVISGFALRFGDSWWARFLFSWEGGYEFRGILHRYAAVFLIAASIWHAVYLFTTRGRWFLRSMVPGIQDFMDLFHMVMYWFGKKSHEPKFGRFAYAEKAEYWALIWGNTVMILTGLFLWFDNYFVQVFNTTFLEVSRTVHYLEAWLATLAILIWHMYHTVFRPSVAPMNPSWLTGKMPIKQFEHEHGGAVPDEDLNPETTAKVNPESDSE